MFMTTRGKDWIVFLTRLKETGVEQSSTSFHNGEQTEEISALLFQPHQLSGDINKVSSNSINVDNLY